jgi:hypothetical protein
MNDDGRHTRSSSTRASALNPAKQLTCAKAHVVKASMNIRVREHLQECAGLRRGCSCRSLRDVNAYRTVPIRARAQLAPTMFACATPKEGRAYLQGAMP